MRMEFEFEFELGFGVGEHFYLLLTDFWVKENG
jgi:hypothetical protein